jgi:hypothetical protein
MSIFKRVAAVAAITGVTVLTAKTLMAAFETTGKTLNNRKLYTPIPDEIKEEFLSMHVHEVNHMFNQIRQSFKTYDITDNEIQMYNESEVVYFNSSSREYQEVEIEVSYPEKKNKKVFYKVFFIADEDRLTNNVYLRIVAEDWNFFVDIKLFSAEAKAISDRVYLKITESDDYIIDPLQVGDYIVLKKELLKDLDENEFISVKNVASNLQVLVGSYRNTW